MIESILLWRETLSVMPDHHFFEIIRMYLGEIKTPYNKQRLIEELSSFLRKEENKQNIIKLLSKSDLEIITAIQELPSATQDKLHSFFCNEMTFAILYEDLMNLEERLVIYRHPDKSSGRIVFDINPLLETTLLPLLKRSNLLPLAELKAENTSNNPPPALTPGFIASFYSFLLEYPDLCKVDESLKKRYEAMLQDVFPAHRENNFLTLMVSAFSNLSLIRMTDCGYTVKNKRWLQFAKLDQASQYSYIAAAAAGHFPRSILQNYAQLILSIVSEIPDQGFTKDILLRSIFLHREKKIPIPHTMHSGRFAAILQRAESQAESASDFTTVCTNEKLFQTIERLGLVYPAGTDIEGKIIYKKMVLQAEDPEKKCASIDSGFSMTILPGLPLSTLLPLAEISVPVRYETISQLEITKSAVMRSFDKGQTPDTIEKKLNDVLSHKLPQNILFSIQDWYESYNSASLFIGYVLKIQAEKDLLVEKNKELAPYIKQKLAPGIFMLDFATKKEAMTVIADSGLNFIGSIKDMHEEEDIPPLPKIYLTASATFRNSSDEGEGENRNMPEESLSNYDAEYSLSNDNESSDFIQKLNDIVDNMNLSVEQTEELKSRIQRRIIVNESQLKAGSVRPEKNEASGMDYLGKIHVTEHAIASESLLNLMYDGATYLVQPVRIEKQAGDAILKALLQPDGTEKYFQIGRVQYLKRIRGSVFKEPDYK
ncbi:MAG: helicase-associated domain-containing protein [Treponemataceae bacterium]|nr:helicase-associated domain-containing protein [Treponemataceae bacterium]